MTNKRKLIYGVLGAGVLTAVALPIFAGGGHCGGRDGHGYSQMGGKHGMGLMNDRMIGKISRKLDLDDTQRDALFDAADDARPEWRAMREQMRESRKAMHTLDPKAEGYDAKVAELAKKHGELASQMTVMMAGMKSTMAEVLTDEQMQELKEMRERRHERSGKWNRS